jgi:aldehyde:ferredoxin oxidoreductase
VDLSTGKISFEDTVAKYREVLGGTGIGYKVLWEEVPAGTAPFDAGTWSALTPPFSRNVPIPGCC